MRAAAGKGPGIFLISIQTFVSFLLSHVTVRGVGRGEDNSENNVLDGRHFKARHVFLCKKGAFPNDPAGDSKQVLGTSCLLSVASGQMQESPRCFLMP